MTSTTRLSRIVNAESWRSALRELALIVAGVLIALWVNSLHDAHEKRQREDVALHQLLDATRQNEIAMAQALYEESTVVERIQRVRKALRSPLPADSIERLVGGTMWVSDFHPLTGIYNGLAQSGDLNLLRNTKVRGEVSVFAGEIEGAMPMMISTAQEDLQKFMELSAIRENDATAASVPQIRGIVAGVGMNASMRGDQLKTLRSHAAKLRKDLEAEVHESGWTPPPPRPF